MNSKIVVAATLALVGTVVVATARTDSTALSDLDKMAAEHEHDSPVASPAAAAAPVWPIAAGEVTFGLVTGHSVRGYLAQPGPPSPSVPGTAPAPSAPGLIVIHEWWGLNENMKAMTRRLATLGYNALAVDLYNGKVADNPDAAKKLAGQAMTDRDNGVAVLREAYLYLRRQVGAGPKMGVIGWSFGGGWSLAAAIEMSKIDAAVMYYGQPEKDRERLAKLHAPLLGFFGADDNSIPPAAVHAMESTLKQLGKSVEVHIYDGAGHAFANPSSTAYRAAAADDAWGRTVTFLFDKLGRAGVRTP